MIVSMTPVAVRSFGILSGLSLLLGVIDSDMFEARIAYLSELLGDPGSGPVGAGVSGTETDSAMDSPYDDSADEMHSEIIKRFASGTGERPPEWILFVPSGPIAHLSHWKFIKGDPDPHPSVPHGHDQASPFPKLDPYLGWIHASTKRISGRLARDDTRALWNDDRFRHFASAALVHFAQEHPNYVWRVSDPLRLPRRR